MIAQSFGESHSVRWVGVECQSWDRRGERDIANRRAVLAKLNTHTLTFENGRCIQVSDVIIWPRES